MDQGAGAAGPSRGTAVDRPRAHPGPCPPGVGEAAARTWLESTNAYLDGARPLDVLQRSGPAPVLEALDAQAWGGAA
ncbi:antitoxin Xre/MbcA/ParS toxin-binding domain-containing protein [Rhodococcus wratislaviensis]|uniref:antitoxin Xre/MbcA/ParS toxin-binding domain-containing protein n=1 Tax=Rhodococcus wratislaviensis TaxID=44752 RepID=UPI00278BBCFA|nr:antitoxin Xre/MbcA/ParS toxin-binding domain-containing protein [Rhodococcus wratislaviensis]